MIIEIAFRLEHFEAGSEYRSDELLSCSFTITAYDGNNRPPKSFSYKPCDVLKGLQGVIYLDDRLLIAGIYAALPLTTYERARACFKARVDKIMSVESLALYGDEHLTLFYSTGVYREACKLV